MPKRCDAPSPDRSGRPARPLLLAPLLGLSVLVGCSTPPPKPAPQAPTRAHNRPEVRPATPPAAAAPAARAVRPAPAPPPATGSARPSAAPSAAPSAEPAAGPVAWPSPPQAPAAAAAPDLPPAQPAPTRAEIEQLPEPEPRIEPIPQGGPNKPYRVAGETVVPMVRDAPYRESGHASWYGRPFHGRRTANGEIFNMYGLSAAHRSMPLPSYARVRNRANGREIIVRVNDRGPFIRGRMLDLSYAAAVKLGLVASGVGQVEIERITAEDIRTGAWRREAAGTGMAQAAAGTATALANPPVASPSAASLSAAPLPAAPGSEALAGENALKPVAALAGDVAGAASAAAGPDAATALAGSAAPGPAATQSPASAGRHWLQLGAFRDLQGATAFQEKLQASAEWLAPLLTLVPERGLTRLQAGPFPSREEAAKASERVRSELNLVPMIINRR